MNQPLPHRPAQPNAVWQAQDTQASSWTSDLHTSWLKCRLCLNSVLDTCWRVSLTEELLVLLLCCRSGIQHALRTWLRASLCDSSSEAIWQLSPEVLSSVVPLFQMSYTTAKLALVMWQVFFCSFFVFQLVFQWSNQLEMGKFCQSPLHEPSGSLCPSSCNVFLCCIKVYSELNFLGDQLIALWFCIQVSNFICMF